MKTETRHILWETLEVMGHCIWRAILHPTKQISQVSNPEPIQLSPLPWQGCVALILLGIGSAITAACLHITDLKEASRFLIYVPVTHLFDRSYFIAKQVHKTEKKELRGGEHKI